MTTPDPFTITDAIASLTAVLVVLAVLAGGVWAAWGCARDRRRG